MALTLNTNVGFVTTAPSSDPTGSDTTSDGSAFVVKDTSPSNAARIVEVGWYKGTGTTSSNTQVGLYSADGATVPGEAGTRLQVTGDQASGTTAGWKVFTGLNWNISPSTVYWLGMQQDSHIGSSTIDSATSGGSGIDSRSSQTALLNPFGGGALADVDGMYAIYAKYIPFTTKVNSVKANIKATSTQVNSVKANIKNTITNINTTKGCIEKYERYWVNNGGNWNDTTHWSYVSNGASGASVPTSAISAYFDDHSFSSGSQSVTLNVTAPCKTMDWTGVTNTPSLVINNQLSIYGSLIISTAVTRSGTANIRFNGSGSWNITSGGMTFANYMVFDSGTGVWTFTDNYRNTSQTDLVNGTFTMGSGITWQTDTYFGESGGGTQTLNCNDATIKCGAFSFTNGMTLNAGTSNFYIIASGADNRVFSTSRSTSATFYNFYVEDYATFNTSTTFNNLTVTCSSSNPAVANFLSTKTYTINGTITANGYNSAKRAVIQSSSLKTPVTITAAAASLTDVDFKDIVGAGTATWSGTRVGNRLGNSNITFSTPKTVYWVGNGGSWLDPTNHWATVSNGTPGVNNFPLPQDTSVFDQYSVISSSQTISIASDPNYGYYVHTGSFDFNGVTNSPALTVDGLYVYGAGDIDLTGIASVSGYWPINAYKSDGGTNHIKTNGLVISTLYIYYFNSSELTLDDNFIGGGTIKSSGGVFNTGIYDLTLSQIGVDTTWSSREVSTFNLGSSNITVGGYEMYGIFAAWYAEASTIVNAGTSTFIINYSSNEGFYGAGKTYNNLTLTNGTATIYGSNTFNTITVAASKTINFANTTTQTVTNIVSNGGSGTEATLNSNSSPTKWTITSSSSIISTNYVKIKDSDATGTAAWYAGDNSVNQGNNTGWFFHAPRNNYVKANIKITTTNNNVARAYILSPITKINSVKAHIKGLLGYWQLDEGSGYTPGDSVGPNRTNLSLSGNETLWWENTDKPVLPGHVTNDWYLQNDGSYDYADAGVGTAIPANLQEFTIQFRFKPFATNDNFGIMGHGYEDSFGGLDKGWFFRFNGSGFWFLASETGLHSSDYGIGGSYSPELNRWHDVALTWKGGSTHQCTIWVDGNLVTNDTTTATGDYIPNPDTSVGFYVGAEYWIDDFRRFINAAIAEVKIWNYVRSDAEIITQAGPNYFKWNFAKANIKTTTTKINSSKGNVKATGQQPNNVKGNIKYTYTKVVSVKANIPGIKVNTVKANIIVRNGPYYDINMVPDPSMENSSTMWTNVYQSGSGAGSRINYWASEGSWQYIIQASWWNWWEWILRADGIILKAGKNYRVSATVMTDWAGYWARVFRFQEVGGAEMWTADFTIDVSYSYYRIYYDFTPSVDCYLYFNPLPNTSGLQAMWYDAVLVTETTESAYFDGDTYGASWLGVADASPSAKGGHRNWSKANIKSVYTQVNSVKGNLQLVRQSANSVKASLLVTGVTKVNTTKANIKTTYTKVVSVKGNILASGQKVNSVKANILITGITKISTVKANLIWIGITKVNTVKASIVVTNAKINAIKANLKTTYTKINSVKGNIRTTGQQVNNAKGNLKQTYLNGEFPTSTTMPPGTMANDASIGTKSWATVDNAKLNDGNYTVAQNDTDTPPVYSNYLKATNFGFSIPSNSKITGIQVEIEENNVSVINAVQDNIVKIIKSDGTYGSENKAKSNYWDPITGYTVYGGAFDLWGETWTKADIEDSDFGVVISAKFNEYYVSGRIDHIRIIVYYTDKGSTTKANISYVGITKTNSAKGYIQVTTTTKVNTVKANIYRTSSVVNTVKASIVVTNTKIVSVKANILRAYTQVNSVKADILRTGNTDVNTTKANILKTGNTSVNSVKADIRQTYTKTNSAKASIVTVGITKVNTTKASIVVTNTKAVSVKANILTGYTKVNSAKGSITTSGQKPNSVKADILAIYTKINSARGQVVYHQSSVNSVKADIKNIYTQINSVKADIKNTYTSVNSVKADILVINNTKANSVKASIVVTNTKVNATKASIVTTVTKVTSVKANIKTTYTKINSVKGNIKTPYNYVNSAKADIKQTYTDVNTTKANIVQTRTNVNSVKANIKTGYTKVVTVKANIKTSYTSIQSVRANILRAYTQVNTVKANIPAQKINSVKANIKTIYTKINSVRGFIYSTGYVVCYFKANIKNTYTQINSVKGQVVYHQSSASSSKANIKSTLTSVNSVKANIRQTYTKINSVKADILKTYTAINTVKANILKINNTFVNSTKADILVVNTKVNTVKASIVVTNTKASTVKANIRTTYTKVNFVKGQVYSTGQIVNNVKANIKNVYAKVNSVKGQIVYHQSAINAVKANIVGIRTNINSVKANLKQTYSAINSAKGSISTGNTFSVFIKANIISRNITKANTVKANIVSPKVQYVKANIISKNIINAQSVKANIKATSTSVNSVKGNITLSNITKVNTVKAYIYSSNIYKINWTKADILRTGNLNVNSAKANIVRTVSIQHVSHANIVVTNTKINSVKANIVYISAYVQFVKANIKVTRTYSNVARGNIQQTYIVTNSVKAHIKPARVNYAKCNILRIATAVVNSVKGCIVVIHTYVNYVCAKLRKRGKIYRGRPYETKEAKFYDYKVGIYTPKKSEVR